MVQRSRITRGGNTTFVNREKERPLSGKVQNQKAAKGEERLARTLEKSISKGLVRQYLFRWTTLKRNVVGYKELDFLVMANNGPVAISVKGEAFVHRSSSSKEQDKINEILIISRLRDFGINVDRVHSIPAESLNTQQDADKVARKLGVYR